MLTPEIRSVKLDLRLTPKAKKRLCEAAAALDCSVTDFVLKSALARAEEALAERRRFGLNAEQWKAFIAALDASPRALPRVKKLFDEKGVFDA